MPEQRERADRYDVIALVLLAAFLVAGFVSIARATPTIDEPYHYLRGAAVWQTADTRLSFVHPPLANTLAALPGVLTTELGDVTTARGWEDADPAWVTTALARGDYPSFRRGMMRGRFVQLGWGLALLAFLYVFTRRELGPLAALVAVAILGLNPSFVAHNAVVTTDGPITCVGFLLIMSAWAHGRRPTRWTLVAFAASLALAPIVKLSGLVLTPIAGLVFAVARLSTPDQDLRERLRALGPIALHALGAILIVIASVNLAYGFDRSGLSMDEIRAEPEPVHFVNKGGLIEKDTLLAELPDQLRVPVPYTYVYGLALVRAQAKRKGRSWFLGKRVRGAHRFYVPIMLFAKSPVAWWLMLIVVFVQAIRRRRFPAVVGLALGFAVVYCLLAARADNQLGMRYLLPCLPFVAFAAASCVSEALAPERRTWLLAVAATVPLALVAAKGKNISWFNQAVGGRAGGHKISMIGEDWGQDLGRVAAKAKALGIEKVHYEAYLRFGPNELSYQGVEAVVFRGRKSPTKEATWVVIHRARELRYPRKYFPWRKRIRETYELDHHIRLYRLAAAPSPKPKRAAKDP